MLMLKLFILFIGFQFASYYQDHMVLQRLPQRTVLWGYGNVSSTVTVKVDSDSYMASVIEGTSKIIFLKVASRDVLKCCFSITVTNCSFENFICYFLLVK